MLLQHESIDDEIEELEPEFGQFEISKIFEIFGPGTRPLGSCPCELLDPEAAANRPDPARERRPRCS